MGLVIALMVYATPLVKYGESDFPVSFYAAMLATYALHQVCCWALSGT